MVINDYAKKNNINIASLTQLEIRDIILGMELPTPSAMAEQVSQVEAARRGEGATVTVQTTNDQNQRITTTATTNY